jgi:hypothetical protein
MDFSGVTSNILIQSNEYLEYAVLVGVTPTVKAGGWYSGLNNIKVSRSTLARHSIS